MAPTTRETVQMRPRQAAETTLFTNILIPTDGTDLAKRAIEGGSELAKALGAAVVIVTVSPPFLPLGADDPVIYPELNERFLEATEKNAAELLDAAQRIAKARGIAAKTLHVRNTSIYRAILDAAKENGCDLIVMASHGRRGLAALLLGSETLKVLTHSTIPVMVWR